jgi:hypothetical protein
MLMSNNKTSRNVVNGTEVLRQIQAKLPDGLSAHVRRWFEKTYLKHELETAPCVICVDERMHGFATQLVAQALHDTKARFESMDRLTLKGVSEQIERRRYRDRKDILALLRKFFDVVGQHIEIQSFREPWSHTNAVYHRITQVSVEHISDLCDLFTSDWFTSRYKPETVSHLSVSEALAKHDEWLNFLNESATTEEDFESLVTLYAYEDGHKIVELISRQNYVREGKLMRSCIASYSSKLKRKRSRVFSLRDSDNQPLLTIHFDKSTETITDIRGFKNRLVTPKELKFLQPFFHAQGIFVFINIGIANDDIDEDYDDDTEDRLRRARGANHLRRRRERLEDDELEYDDEEDQDDDDDQDDPDYDDDIGDDWDAEDGDL